MFRCRRPVPGHGQLQHVLRRRSVVPRTGTDRRSERHGLRWGPDPSGRPHRAELHRSSHDRARRTLARIHDRLLGQACRKRSWIAPLRLRYQRLRRHCPGIGGIGRLPVFSSLTPRGARIVMVADAIGHGGLEEYIELTPEGEAFYATMRAATANWDGKNLIWNTAAAAARPPQPQSDRRPHRGEGMRRRHRSA